MINDGNSGVPKPATAARIYDYYLGGTHNFVADRLAAKAMTEMFPYVPAMARTGRAFMRRTVRHLTDLGLRQFLDIGSGIPTEGNVHEIAQGAVPECRVVYVDLDPTAVAESMELLEGNERAIAVRGDVCEPERILGHPQVNELLDFSRPIGLLLSAVLHFAPDDTAYSAVRRFVAALAPGSHVVISHAVTDSEDDEGLRRLRIAQALYQKQTATPFMLRTRADVLGFFDGLELIDPGLVWLPSWRPEPEDPTDFTDDPPQCRGVGGIGRVM